MIKNYFKEKKEIIDKNYKKDIGKILQILKKKYALSPIFFQI